MKKRNVGYVDYRLLVGVVAFLIGIVSAAAGIARFGVPVGVPMLLIGVILILYVVFEKK